MKNITLNRRKFLAMGLSAGALFMTIPHMKMGGKLKAEEQTQAQGTQEWVVSPLIKLNPDNTVEIFYQSPEMGQGTATSLPMILAEEMEVDWGLVTVSPLDYGLRRDEEGRIRAKYIGQGAGGSSSTPRNWPLARKAGAEARQILLQAGAKYFKSAVNDVRAEKSFVIHSSGKKVPFGQLLELAENEVVPDRFKPEFKGRDDWSIIGTPQKQKELNDIITGKTIYGIDADYPGVKIAVVARSPYFDGFVKSVNDTKARAIKGVIDVVVMDRPPLDGNYTYLAAGVAVIADTFWTAKKARDLLEIEWDKGPYTSESSNSLTHHFDDLLSGKGQIVRKDGDYDNAIKSASKVITRTYKMPYVAHVTLEPQNCIAYVEADKVTILGPLQSPTGAAYMANRMTGIDLLKMDIKYTRLGGGFGRRLTSDHAAEAIAISQLSGLPIKVMWTREDDMTHDFYRPAGHQEITAGFDDNGKMVAWTQRLASATKYYRRDNVKEEDHWNPELYVNDFPRGLVDNFQNEYFSAKSGVSRGSWRAPAHTVNAFAIQSFLDEAAEEFDEDPLDFRLRFLGEPQSILFGDDEDDRFDTARMATVLREAAKMANWGRDMPAGYGLGIASHFTFGGYCALVAEVEMLTDTTFKVHKVYGSVDLGIIINPAGVLSQMEGSINDGLSAALGQAIEVDGGQVINDNFDTYKMMRLVDSVPKVEVHMVTSDIAPQGIGEVPLPPLAPAVTNALVSAGGKRLRSHPLSKGE